MSGAASRDPTRLDRSLPLDQVLEYRARAAPGEPSLIFARPPLGETLDFAELDRRARAASASLRRLGVGPGDIVGLVLEDSPESFAAVYGAWRVGAAIMPIDARWGPQTLESILRHAQPALVAHGGAADRSALDGWKTASLAALVAGAPEETESFSRPESLAVVAFTSGTTSSPKGVMISHANLRAAYSIAREHLFDATPPRRFGSVFNIGGLGVLGLNFLFAMECGSATVVLPALSLADAAGYWQQLAAAEVDFLYLVPTLVQLVTRITRPVPSRLRLCVTGAAPISPDVHAQFQDRFGVPLRNIYGMTEASFGIFYGAQSADGRGAWHLGTPADPIEVRLRGDDGEIVVGPGRGILEVTGPVVTGGYLRNPDATAETFRDGWVVTGDIAARDEDNCFSIVGRAKDVVIRGGFNIHLDEVDQALLAHPQVISACAVGIPTGTSEEALGAMVQVTAEFSGKVTDLLAWCRSRIGTSKTPTLLEICARDLPRNSHGKLLRSQVRDALLSRESGAAG